MRWRLSASVGACNTYVGACCRVSTRVDACQRALPRVDACLAGSRRSSSSGALLRSGRPLAGAEPWRTRANRAAEQALSMRSAVHALGYCRARELSTGSGSAHAATPCGEVCACQLSRYASGLRHPQRFGGSRGKRRHAQVMVGVWKGFTSRNLQRSKWWAAPVSSRARMAPRLGTLLRGWLAFGSLACRRSRFSARLPARLRSGIARAWVDRSCRIVLCNHF